MGSRLVNGHTVTQDPNHMWCQPLGGQELGVTFNLVRAETVTGFRIWNYNTSLDDSYRGVSPFDTESKM